MQLFTDEAFAQIPGQTAMSTDQHQPGTPIIIRWLFGDAAYGRADATYTATLICVDFMGTVTFRRDEDGFLGVAGSGAWTVA